MPFSAIRIDHVQINVTDLPRARAFYEHLGFRELTRTGSDVDGVVYMGKSW